MHKQQIWIAHSTNLDLYQHYGWLAGFVFTLLKGTQIHCFQIVIFTTQMMVGGGMEWVDKDALHDCMRLEGCMN